MRARDLGIPFVGEPGPWNAITDVAEVAVGHTTLISGEGPLVVGQGPIRTGVTAVLPRGLHGTGPVFAGWFSLNGNGEMTGTTWIEESGLLDSPVLLTNTHSVGVVRDAVIAWQNQQNRMPGAWSLPVVAETWDGWLNDINGFHVRPAHVFAALESASHGPVAEGGVGGGTGMICYEFKGGIGTASRRVSIDGETYTVGVLVQANHGLRRHLLIAGIPVGQELIESGWRNEESGSIIGLIATDAPMLPHQLKALAKRAALGMARTGGIGAISSGDLFLAFSTANLTRANVLQHTVTAQFGMNGISALYEACVLATEEAILNVLVAAETMTGIENRTVPALPHDQVQQILRKHHRHLTPRPPLPEGAYLVP